ncbi:MAG: ribonuclease HII [Lachnospiraceae bacterium]|nr:ribonuclease HII [Lachnospiraceae bacterium]
MEKKISEIKSEFALTGIDGIEGFINEYADDERPGVQALVLRAKKNLEKYNAELKRIYSISEYERKYREYRYICGIDEVGRGPLAGPVVAGAVILPKDCCILYVNDSKKLSETKREELYDEIMDKAVSVGLGFVDNNRIDEINILQATYEAMRQAIGKLDPRPDILLNDAVTIPEVSIKQVPIIKGDAKSISIGAASIIAKVTRDRMMKEYAEEFPEYGFEDNKGYGSRKHIEAIHKYGPCALHRRSFIGNFT